MTEPTDAEIVAVMRDGYNCRYNDEQDHIDFARAVLAKWGTSPAVAGEPMEMCLCESHRLVLRLGQPYIFREMEGCESCKTLADQAREAYGPTGGAPAVTPQPTQAQAGAVESAEFDQFLSDVLTAAGLVTHGKQCKALGERLADMCMKLRIHGIKGGQHAD